MPAPRRPSFGTGFARRAWESEAPHLWHGLIGCWAPMLGQQGNTLFDISGYSRHGTLTNMAPATDWVAGRTGPVLDFDGTNDYVSVPVIDTASITILVRCIPRSVAGNIELVSNVDDTWILRLADNDNGFAGPAFLTFVTGFEVAGSTAALATGIEHTIAATYDGETMLLYANGVQLATNTTPSGSLVNTGLVRIGIHANTVNNPFNGQLLEVKLYDRALSAGEILAHSVDPDAMLRLRPLEWAVPEASGPTVGEIMTALGNAGRFPFLRSGPLEVRGV